MTVELFGEKNFGYLEVGLAYECAGVLTVTGNDETGTGIETGGTLTATGGSSPPPDPDPDPDPVVVTSYRGNRARTLQIPITVTLASPTRARNITRECGDVRFRHTIPGGFATCNADLNRAFTDYSDELAQFARLRLTDGRHGGVLSEGRLEDPGRTASAQGQVWQLSALGAQVHAKDNTGPYVAIDSSMAPWVAAPKNPKNTSGSAEQITQDTPVGEPASTPPTVYFDGLKMSPDQGVALANGMIVASWMYPVLAQSGQTLASVAGSFLNGYLGGDIGHRVTLYVGQDEAFTTGALTPSGGPTYNFGGANPPIPVNFLWRKSVDWNSSTGTEPVPAITWLRAAPEAQSTGPQHWLGVAAIVRPIMHDQNGTSIPANSPFDVSSCSSDEVFADLVGSRLPLWDPVTTTITAGTDGLINQLAYPDPVTVDQILTDLMDLEGQIYYWAAWESYTRQIAGVTAARARAEWSLWPTAVRHVIGMRDGCDLPTSTEQVYDSVTVRWKDATGRTRSTLVSSANDLLTGAGVHRRGTVDASDNVVVDVAGATSFGARWLTDNARPRGTGTLTVAREVLDRFTGRILAPWELRPGCLVQIAGADPSAYSQGATTRNGRNVFRVMATEFDSAAAAATLELDSPPNSIWDQVAQANRDLVTRRRR